MTDMQSTIEELRFWYRKRCYAMEGRKIMDLRLGAELRTQLGWSRSLPKAEADAIAKHAKKLISLGEKVIAGKATGVGDPDFAKFQDIVSASIQGRKLWDEIEKHATQKMERLSVDLPATPWWQENVFAKSLVSLAVIVGEAGDLLKYPKKGHLWKRMGLAVIDGVRQGGLPKTASKEQWIAHGYNRKRRSTMFVIGDSLVKKQGPYRKIYLARKLKERADATAAGLIVAPAAKIPEKRKHEFVSDGHIHHRSQRYMEKQLLKHLLQAWKRAIEVLPVMATADVPVSTLSKKKLRRVS